MGRSVDVALAAVDNARVIIAQINPRMPRVHGDGHIHVSQTHHAIEIDEPLPEVLPTAPREDEKSIAKFAASIIENGSTFQMGIGVNSPRRLRCA